MMFRPTALASLGMVAALAAAHGADLTAVLPDPVLTPGEVRTSAATDVCGDRRTRQFRHWSRARDDRILAEYGLPTGPHPDFEVDHLIPLDLGGADDDRNLWPEPRRSIEREWNAERKDLLEWKLADLVCSGRLDLTVAPCKIGYR
jgi:5-methylcytosine-specific restriction endonuclease McrA